MSRLATLAPVVCAAALIGCGGKPIPAPAAADGDPSPAPAVGGQARGGDSRPSESAGPAGGRRRALLVGVNRYQHPDLAPLKYAEADAAELREVLAGGGYETTLLVGPAATRAAVEAAVKAAADRCRAGDTLIVGLAGHGVQFEGDREAYFCPVDARPAAARKDTLVSLAGVSADLSASFAGAKLLLVDACRNDPGGGRGAVVPPPPPRGIGVLMSCSPGERAFEHDSLKHGVFFYHVIQGLRREAKDKKGRVTWDGLRGYVKDQVSEQVPTLIGNGAKQQPNDRSDLSGASPVLIAAAAVVARPGPGLDPEKMQVPGIDLSKTPPVVARPGPGLDPEKMNVPGIDLNKVQFPPIDLKTTLDRIRAGPPAGGSPVPPMNEDK